MSISERPIIPFTQFVQSMHAARAEHFLNAPTSKIAHESAFNEMWAHLTNYYDNVTCAHTFVDANGSVFDCIPVEQQVSRRGQSGAIPTAPDLPVAVTQTAAPPPPAGQLLQLHPDLRDPLGNQMLAPDGTIPVRRMTIEDMSRFRTLRHYMEKSPGVGGGLRPPGASRSLGNPG